VASFILASLGQKKPLPTRQAQKTTIFSPKLAKKVVTETDISPLILFTLFFYPHKPVDSFFLTYYILAFFSLNFNFELKGRRE
jgi:hypothetical protein